jgi:hypothetical protein
MATWDELLKGIVHFAGPRIFPDILSDEEEKTETTVPHSRTQPNELFDRIFGGFSEISDTYAMMKDVEIYLRQFPYSRSGIPRGRHLLFLIQSHLNEIYILRERLISYATIVERTYKKSPRGTEIAKIAERARMLAKQDLSSISFTRGSHVHTRRFADEKVDHFLGTELIVTHSDADMLGPNDRRYMEWEYKEVRREWVKRVRAINESAGKLLDMYAALLYGILFDSSGNFIEPKQGAYGAPNSSATPDANRSPRGRRR